MEFEERKNEKKVFYAADTKTDYALLKIVLDVNNIQYDIVLYDTGNNKHQVRFYVHQLNHELIDREKVLLIERVMKKDEEVIAIYNHECTSYPYLDIA